MVIGTDCTGSCKSNYHTIMATTAPEQMSTFIFLVTFSSISAITLCYSYNTNLKDLFEYCDTMAYEYTLVR